MLAEEVDCIEREEKDLCRLHTIGVGDRGGWGAAALPTLEKFAKIIHNRADYRPKVGQNFRKQLIFYRAAPPKFYSPLRLLHTLPLKRLRERQ